MTQSQALPQRTQSGARKSAARALRIGALGWSVVVAASLAAGLPPLEAVTVVYLAAPALVCAIALAISWHRPTVHGLWCVAALAGLVVIGAASVGLFFAPALVAVLVARLLGT